MMVLCSLNMLEPVIELWIASEFFLLFMKLKAVFSSFGMYMGVISVNDALAKLNLSYL